MRHTNLANKHNTHISNQNQTQTKTTKRNNEVNKEYHAEKARELGKPNRRITLYKNS